MLAYLTGMHSDREVSYRMKPQPSGLASLCKLPGRTGGKRRFARRPLGLLRALAATAALALPLAPVAWAGSPVLVELFTSQGCSACPPADEMLTELAKRDDVVALALHVDYWDYIGWKDGFAIPGHTARQKGYAKAAGSRMIYTPHMVVDGKDHVTGTKPAPVNALIEAHKAEADAVDLSVEKTANGLRIRASAGAPLGREAVVQVLRYIPSRKVEIQRGENAGKTITYANIVSGWDYRENWDGAAPLDVNVPLAGKGPAVVIIQEAGYGPVLAVSRIH